MAEVTIGTDEYHIYFSGMLTIVDNWPLIGTSSHYTEQNL